MQMSIVFFVIIIRNKTYKNGQYLYIIKYIIQFFNEDFPRLYKTIKSNYVLYKPHNNAWQKYLILRCQVFYYIKRFAII